MASSPSGPGPQSPGDHPHGAESGPSAPQPSTATELSAAERRELGEVRQRLAALERSLAPGARRHRLRTLGATLLIVLASLLSLLSVVAVWANSIVGDTDRYVATVAPLASNPDVQAAITNRVTTVVLDQIDVKAVVNQLSEATAQQGVPQPLANLVNGLSGPITSGLNSLVSGVVDRVVTSSAFDTLWIEANRSIHTAVDNALTGRAGSTVSLDNNQVTIDLAPVIARAKDQLVDSGLTVAARIPDIHTSFVVFASKDIGKVKTYFRLLEIVGGWLPVVTVLVAAAGVFTAVNRRRGLTGAALGVATAMLLLGVALAVFRALYLDRLPSGTSAAAAGAIFDALVRFLRVSVRAVGVTALVTALGVLVIGPSRAAVFVRTACRTGIGAVRGAAESTGLRLGPVGRFVHAYKRWIGVLVLVVGAVVLATWSYPTTAVVLWITALVLVAFGIREFLDTGPQRAAVDRPPAEGDVRPTDV